MAILPSRKVKRSAAGYLHALTVLWRASERPFRHTTIARDEMPGARPVRVMESLEHCGVRGANGLLTLAPLSVDLRPGRCCEHTVVGHHGHQRVEIVSVPRVGETVQQRRESPRLNVGCFVWFALEG